VKKSLLQQHENVEWMSAMNLYYEKDRKFTLNDTPCRKYEMKWNTNQKDNFYLRNVNISLEEEIEF
jgi:transposase